MLTLKEALLGQDDLKQLCADRPPAIGEHTAYGIDSILKQYAGLPGSYRLKVINLHGITWREDFILEADMQEYPVIFCYPPYRKNIFITKTKKKVILSASPFLYLVELLKGQPQPPRQGTIFFIPHSSISVLAELDLELLAEKLLNLSDEYKPITICVYWKDFHLGRHIPFQKRGFRIVSAGHAFDPDFLFRYYHLCSIHRYSASINLGSHIFYSIKAGCSYFHLNVEDDLKISYIAEEHVLKSDFAPPTRDREAAIKSLFMKPQPSMTKEQMRTVDYYLGADYLKSPAGLCLQLIWAELLYFSLRIKGKFSCLIKKVLRNCRYIKKGGVIIMRGKEAVMPSRILGMGWDFARSRTLATGVELNVFTHIADGKRTAGEIAGAAGSNRRGMEMLLDALVGLELLKKERKGNYRLAPDSGQFLVRGKPGFLGGMCSHTSQLNKAWDHLTESVKTGKPYMRVDEDKTAEGFFPDLVKALFNMNYQAARYAASFLRKKGRNITNILDVAAGSSVWGIGFAQEFHVAKLTAIDFPSVCKVAREHAQNFKLDDRFECIEGDIRSIDFGANLYDLVILGHICHSEGRINTGKLLKKSYNALKPGGCLLIAEFMPNDAKTAPAIPLLFGLNMLVNTNEGGVYTIKEFKEWLTALKFKKIEILDKAPSISPLILATK